MIARSQLGAHDEYDDFRFVLDLIAFVKAVEESGIKIQEPMEADAILARMSTNDNSDAGLEAGVSQGRGETEMIEVDTPARL